MEKNQFFYDEFLSHIKSKGYKLVTLKLFRDYLKETKTYIEIHYPEHFLLEYNGVFIVKFQDGYYRFFYKKEAAVYSKKDGTSSKVYPNCIDLSSSSKLTDSAVKNLLSLKKQFGGQVEKMQKQIEKLDSLEKDFRVRLLFS